MIAYVEFILPIKSHIFFGTPMTTSYQITFANKGDIFQLAKVYHEVYGGTYPDPMMKDFTLMEQFITSPNNYWIVAKSGNEIIGSVIYRYYPNHRLGKVYGAAVLPEFRRHGLTAEMMKIGLIKVKEAVKDLEVVYATTRTIHEGAQKITESLGYKKIGILPNVHKTSQFETHCVVALYEAKALSKRHTSYRLHHKLADLFSLVQRELLIDMPPLVKPDSPSRVFQKVENLEIIDDAPKFVAFRYEALKAKHKLLFKYYPFDNPNFMLLTPDQTTEVFLDYSRVDGSVVVLGVHTERESDYADLFTTIALRLRDFGCRYLEIMVKANHPKVIESMLAAKFIPSAFFPAFQLEGEMRLDFVVMSRTFEILDFGDLKLEGLNRDYMDAYCRHWEDVSIRQQKNIN